MDEETSLPPIPNFKQSDPKMPPPLTLVIATTILYDLTTNSSIATVFKESSLISFSDFIIYIFFKRKCTRNTGGNVGVIYSRLFFVNYDGLIES